VLLRTELLQFVLLRSWLLPLGPPDRHVQGLRLRFKLRLLRAILLLRTELLL
jgi:hypothetical protein